MRLEEGPQFRVLRLLLAEMPPTSFCEHGLTSFFSCFPCEEKTIKMTFRYWPSDSPFISAVRTLTITSKGMTNDLDYQQKGSSEAKGNSLTEKCDLSRFLTTPWLFLPSSAAGGAWSSTITRSAVLWSCRYLPLPPPHLKPALLSHLHSRPNTTNS